MCTNTRTPMRTPAEAAAQTFSNLPSYESGLRRVK